MKMIGCILIFTGVFFGTIDLIDHGFIDLSLFNYYDNDLYFDVAFIILGLLYVQSR